MEYGTIKHELDIGTVLSRPQLIVKLFGCCWVSYCCSVPGVTSICVLRKVPYQLYLALIHFRTKCRKSWTDKLFCPCIMYSNAPTNKKAESFIKQILWPWKCQEIPFRKIIRNEKCYKPLELHLLIYLYAIHPNTSKDSCFLSIWLSKMIFIPF